MITLYDYLPSQNAWKVRQLLCHLAIPYRTEIISIFEGAGQNPQYLAINPWGAVPAIRLEDGRVLPESRAQMFAAGLSVAVYLVVAWIGAKIFDLQLWKVFVVRTSTSRNHGRKLSRLCRGVANRDQLPELLRWLLEFRGNYISVA